ncbi:hypothetical protein SAMD00019534_040680 [Acytostelium subglobosum LB1]|uniref:hypothetical protein n=1 Tax=Acytostelium subglobosum LB1 TaxID=1410327 RepID=UPI000644AE04|nr:hypothetical protein SAMD00019534_040680 [Acytostelium subglobosum LB1]GAM20893.1 hypothetical protein SAMD00019534_040680 [Acytostelium subglobosum LB1]|eukprot:XP_012756027.1 hypothetical protein SAMD00019534_040680 [Acytostelium subglobosum LB1]
MRQGQCRPDSSTIRIDPLTLSNTLTQLDISCHRMTDFTFLNKLPALRKLRIQFREDYERGTDDYLHPNTEHRFAQAYAANTTIKKIKLLKAIEVEHADMIASNPNLERFDVPQDQRFKVINTTLRHLKVTRYGKKWYIMSDDDISRVFLALETIENSYETIWIK